MITSRWPYPARGRARSPPAMLPGRAAPAGGGHPRRRTRPGRSSTRPKATFFVMMTRDSATAAIAMIAARVVTWLRFENDRKCGAWMATTAHRITITPARVSSRDRPMAPATRAPRPNPEGRTPTSADIGRLRRASWRRPGRGAVRRGRRVGRPDLARAANMTRSSVASRCAISAVTRPSCRTRIRSLMARTSGRSLEIRKMPGPRRPGRTRSGGPRPSRRCRRRGSARRGSALAASDQPLGDDDLLLVAARERLGKLVDARHSNPELIGVALARERSVSCRTNGEGTGAPGSAA